MAAKQNSSSKARAKPVARPAARTPKSSKAAVTATKKKTVSTVTAAHTQQTKFLVSIFTLLSVVFAAMAFWRYS